MYARAEVAEQYKQAVREYIRQNNEFKRGRMSGLATSLGCLGVSIPEIDEMCHTCEGEVKDERAQEDIYECEHCNAEFKESEILYRDYGGEIGAIAFCPRCKEETKLICVTEVGQ